MSKSKKSPQKIAEAVNFVTESDDEEYKDAFWNDVEGHLGGDNDLPCLAGEIDELIHSKESQDNENEASNVFSKSKLFPSPNM